MAEAQVDWKDPEAAATLLADNWQDWPFLGGPVGRGAGWFGTVMVSHEKTPLERSNLHVAVERLTALRDDDNWCTSTFAGAFGRGEHLWVRTRDDQGQVTPAWREWCAMALSMEGYPALDDTLMSEYEVDDLREEVRRRLGGTRLSPRRFERLVRRLCEDDYIDTTGSVYVRDSNWQQALRDLRVPVEGPGLGV